MTDQQSTLEATSSKGLVLGELSWPEVDSALSGVKVAVVPVGSCEQHGPNSSFTTDTEKANEFCKLLARRVGGKILVFPPIGYGLSTHHMGFPGTVTLSVETMISLLTDIATAISKHGIRKILFVNGHGGNRVALDASIIKLKYERGIDAYWTAMGTRLFLDTLSKEMTLPKVIGHACEVETSQCLFLAPWVVMPVLQPGTTHEESAYFRRVFRDGNAAWDWKRDASENGALGNACRASRDIGERMTELALTEVIGIIDEIIAR